MDLDQRCRQLAGASTFEPDGAVGHAVEATAEAFGAMPEVLLGTDRSRAAANARAVAMTAARIHGHSLPTIARHFGRDHTTVRHQRPGASRRPHRCATWPRGSPPSSPRSQARAGQTSSSRSPSPATAPPAPGRRSARFPSPASVPS